MKTDIVIEIPKKSFVKYEFDEITNCMRCDRILSTPVPYPFNYGYFPNTLSSDGDPLDAILIMEHSLYPGTIIEVRVIGGIDMIDNGEKDPKVLVVPVNYKPTDHITNLNELEEYKFEQIKWFLLHYKDLENKKVQINGLYNKLEAESLYDSSIIKFKSQLTINT